MLENRVRRQRVEVVWLPFLAVGVLIWVNSASTRKDNTMFQFLARVLINGLFLAFLLPALVPSVAFHGEFWPQGVAAGAIFALVTIAVELLLFAFGLVTLGFGFVLRLLLWFVVPALQLLAMAHWFPQYLTVGSFGAALIGGFLLMIVNWVTNSTPTGSTRSS